MERTPLTLSSESMQQFDIALKTLLQSAATSLVHLLTGLEIKAWLNIELPKAQTLRADLLGCTASGELLQIELQLGNDPGMALRMVKYYLRIYEVYGMFPRQIVLYVGKPPMDMPAHLSAPSLTFRYQLVDIRTINGEPLLTSPNMADNILAVLTKLNNQSEAVHQIVSRIATLESSEREAALTQLLIVAGLRNLEQIVRKEVQHMPAYINLLENTVLGPMILEELEKGRNKYEQEIDQKAEQKRQREQQEALQRGMQQGMQQGRLSLLLRQMEKRFGPLPQHTQARLTQLSIDDLDELCLRLLDAQSLDELFSSLSWARTENPGHSSEK